MQNATLHPPYSLFAKPNPVAVDQQGIINMAGSQPDQSSSEQCLVDFMRLTRDCFWETDAALRLTMVSRRAVDVIGYPADELLGKPLTDFGIFTDKHGKPGQVSMKGNFRDACFLATDALGEQRHLCLSAIAFFDPHTGAFQGVRGIARPLTNSAGVNN